MGYPMAPKPRKATFAIVSSHSYATGDFIATGARMASTHPFGRNDSRGYASYGCGSLRGS
jgi:hypothetical protein